MPIARFQLPDGRIGRFEVPEGTTPEQAQSMISGQYQDLIPKQEDTFSSRVGENLQERKQGILGALPGIMQMNTPQELGGEMIRQGVGLAGDVIGPALTGAAEAVSPYVPQKFKDIASALGTSALESDAGQYAMEKAKQAGELYGQAKEQYPRATRDIENITAALTAGVGTQAAKQPAKAVGQAVEAGADVAGNVARNVGARALPAVDKGLAETARLAQKYNIPLSFDQITSSPAVANLQKVSQELPFSGQQAFRDKQMKTWQKEIFKTFGVDADSFTPKTMEKAFSKVGGEFDDITKGKSFNIGGDFIDNLTNVANDIPSTYGIDASEAFQREALKVINAFKGDSVSGEVIARERSRINALARQATGEKKLAMQDLENAIISGITSNDPAIEAALAQAKQRYKNLIVVEPLAAKAKGGNINPTLLNNRVSRVYGRAHTVGKSGDIGNLARIGLELMPVKGGSDTAQKLIYATGATGGAIANAPLTAATLAGNRLVQSKVNRNQDLIRKALERSAVTAGDTSGAVPMAPALGLGGGALGLGLSGQEAQPQNPTPEAPEVAPQSSVSPLLDKIMMAESGGDVNAKNPRSNAVGAFQYIPSTWKSAVKKYGKELGVTAGDIKDPQAQAAITQKLIEDEYVPSLTKTLGREPSEGEIYLAHFAGAPAASKLLKSPPKVSAASVLPTAAKSNPAIFFEGGRPRSVAEVLNIINNKVA